MKTYIYTNHKSGEVIVIHANDILQADKQYQIMVGINPAKLSDIGCCVKGVQYEYNT